MTSLILIIEDDRAIGNNLVELLFEEGYGALVARKGADGITFARARRPALILCDILMPETDGYAVLQAVRAGPETSAIPFVFLTARADTSELERAMSLGVDGYLTKPFTRAQVLDVVRNHLARPQTLCTPEGAPSTPLRN